jgi:hypothetical protein
MTLSSMYLKMRCVSSGFWGTCDFLERGARGNTKSSWLRESDLVRLAFFSALIMCANRTQNLRGFRFRFPRFTNKRSSSGELASCFLAQNAINLTKINFPRASTLFCLFGFTSLPLFVAISFRTFTRLHTLAPQLLFPLGTSRRIFLSIFNLIDDFIFS